MRGKFLFHFIFILVAVITLGAALVPCSPAHAQEPPVTPAVAPADMRLRLEDFPPGFEQMDPAELGLSEEDLSTDEFKVENLFIYVYTEMDASEIVIGFTITVESKLKQLGVDMLLENPDLILDSLISSIGVAERAQSQELAGLKGIGDESTGVSVVADMEGITFQVDVLLFRRGEVGAVAMTMCMLGPKCLMDIRQVGEKLDKRIHVAKMLATLIAALRPGESRPTMPSPLTTSVPSLEGTAIIPTLTPKKTLFRLDIVEREESPGDRLVGTSAVQIRNPRDPAEVIGNLSDDEVVEVVERTENREFLRVKLVDRGGQPEVAVWAPEEASSEQTQLWHLASFPPPTPTLWRRATGLLKAPGWGLGELTVENGRNLDAVAVLTIDDTPVAAAYIRAGESYTIKGISEGTYSLYFNIGEDWSDASARFTRKSLYFRFEDTLTFRTTTIPGGMEYTTFRVTLHPMLGGTARTLPISAEQFPALR